MDQSETDTDSETPMGHASIWVQTHTICYRPVPENDPCNYTRYHQFILFWNCSRLQSELEMRCESLPLLINLINSQRNLFIRSPNAPKNQGHNLACSSSGYTRKGKGASGKNSSKKKGDELWNGNFNQVLLYRWWWLDFSILSYPSSF